jgi:signal transduction histidine kinase
MGRPNQLGQVFLNILMNAKQAIRHDHGVITLRSGTVGSEAWISVEDNGCGIAAAHMHRLFEPFFTTKEVGKGTGLGLSLCHSIVLQHGGRIEVASELELYSRFTLFFPLAPRLRVQD